MTGDERYDREERVIMLRENGLTYKAIGIELGGLSVERVRQIYLGGLRKRRLIDEGKSYLHVTDRPKRFL